MRQGGAAIVITDTHAHGLAGHGLRLLRERCRSARDGAFRTVRETEPVTTGKGARRLLATVNASYGPMAWTQRAATDRRGTYAAWLVPMADAESIAVCCASLRIPVRASAELRQWPWMIVPKHAIARGHQRLRDTDWASVQSEFSVVARHASAVLLLSLVTGLKQFAIPAIHGLLIGDVEKDVLRARTFIVPPFSRRWGKVLDAWLRFEQRGSAAWSHAINDAALDHQTTPLADALAALAEELADCDFLRRPHEPGTDVEGDLWEAARAQAAREDEAAARTLTWHPTADG
ncbi:MAG: hypothetical protein ACRES3_00285 [Steroidobacteraceae bacterium]